MDVIERHDIELCEDCVLLLANGGGDYVDPSWDPVEGREDGSSIEAFEAHKAAVEKHWECWEPGHHWELVPCVQPSDEEPDENWECEGYFSWTSCDGCESRLGGTRHSSAALLVRRSQPPAAPKVKTRRRAIWQRRRRTN